ncbi:MAG: hypothetical protein WCR67_06385 [Bacilli bacterium]
MKKFYLKWSVKTLKSEFLIFVVTSVFTAVIFVLFSFFAFDSARIDHFYGVPNDIPYFDRAAFTNWGVIGITKQSYLFSMIFMIFSLLIVFILSGFLSYKKNSGDIFLLRVKGYSKLQSQYSFLLVRTLFEIISLLPSYILYYLAILIIDYIAGTKMPLLIFESQTIMFSLGFVIAFFLINFLFSNLPYNERNIIRYMRNKY